MGLSKIWVYAEATPDGGPTSLTLEILSKARELADTVECVTSADGAPMAEALGAHGATTVHAAGGLGESLPGPTMAAAIEGLMGSAGTPDAIFFGQTYEGRDVMSRLSVALDQPVLTNNVDVVLDGDTLVVEEPVFGGTKNVHTAFRNSGVKLATFRPKSFNAEPSGGGAAAVSELATGDVGVVGAARVVERHAEERSGPQLDEAAVVVAGGRGMGDAERYQVIEELAKLLGGAPGASRAIVDAGWVPFAYQVGQTGKVVKPTVYLAAGISGATQHLVGMKGSKHIIAVNKDPEAPIFSVADLGIIGDAHKVLPALVEAIKARQ